MNDEPAARAYAPLDQTEPGDWRSVPSADAGPADGTVFWHEGASRVSAPPKFQDRRWLHLLLLILTIGSTTIAGVSAYESFTLEFLPGYPQSSLASLLLHGLWYSGTILAILGCHEMGHYFACRHYDVDASLPFFLPMPILFTGTLGAVIRIREPIPSKRMLFDIGIAGPIAGFVVAVPALVLGLSMSRFVPIIPVDQLPPSVISYVPGEPLLFKLAAWLICGATPAGYELNWHPVALAAWFGLLTTALNLFPVGQLDGGHISYAALGRRSSQVTLAAMVMAVALALFSSSYIVWTGLLVIMLAVFGRHHPRTFDENDPLDRRRLMLAIAAVAIFVLCFTPAPIEVIGR